MRAECRVTIIERLLRDRGYQSAFFLISTLWLWGQQPAFIQVSGLVGQGIGTLYRVEACGSMVEQGISMSRFATGLDARVGRRV